jgi:hypothetical protein
VCNQCLASLEKTMALRQSIWDFWPRTMAPMRGVSAVGCFGDGLVQLVEGRCITKLHKDCVNL